MQPFSLPWNLGVAIIIAGILYYIWKSWGFLFLGLRIGKNDPQFVTDTFKELLADAKQNLLLCDDGNIMPGSLYEDKRVVKAISERLTENQDLEIFCIFHSRDDTEFIRQFANNPRVHMARGVLPRPAVHFKIIDDGKKGYLTAHDFESSDRNYRLYNCSWVPASVRDKALGRHVRWAKEIIANREANA